MSTEYSFPITIRFKFQDAIAFWKLVDTSQLRIEHNLEKNQLAAFDQERLIFQFKAPLVTPISSADKYLVDNAKIEPFAMVLMQPGNAALGYFENGEAKEHKVIRKYMTRKKQGRAQVYHLKTKGKSRAGSRVRLEETQEFFEEIHQKLIDWDILNRSKLIFYHASPVLWPMLFDIQHKLAFNKEDKRLVKIPRDVNTPIFDELIRTANFLKTAELVVVDKTFFEHQSFKQSFENALTYWKI